MGTLLFGAIVLGWCGCDPNEPDSQYDTTSFTMDSLSVQRLARTSSEPAAFFVGFTMTNESEDKHSTLMTHFIFQAGNASTEATPRARWRAERTRHHGWVPYTWSSHSE